MKNIYILPRFVRPKENFDKRTLSSDPKKFQQSNCNEDTHQTFVMFDLVLEKNAVQHQLGKHAKDEIECMPYRSKNTDGHLTSSLCPHSLSQRTHNNKAKKKKFNRIY